MLWVSTTLQRLGVAQSGMTAVGFGLLSAMIGLVIFGSAMALGFQSSTLIAPFGGPIELSEVSMRESPVSYLAAEDSGETSDMVGPAALKGAISAPPSSRVSDRNAASNSRLAFGGISTRAERAVAKDPSRLAPISTRVPGETGPAARPEMGADLGTPGAARPDIAVPLFGAITTGTRPKGETRTAFETSTPMQLGTAADGADGEAVIFEYPIPPIPANSELQLGEDPLAAAAVAVPQGTQRSLGKAFALLAPVEVAKTGPRADPQPTGGSLLDHNFVLSFNLTEDQLMLVFMVTGLIAVAAFLWLASSWLGDRSSIKRKKLWERQQAAALAEAEEAEGGANGGQERVAA